MQKLHNSGHKLIFLWKLPLPKLDPLLGHGYHVYKNTPLSSTLNVARHQVTSAQGAG